MTGLVANVLFPEPNEELVAKTRDLLDAGGANRYGDHVFFNVDGYLALHDEDDPDSGLLYATIVDYEGVAVTVYAPDTDDVAELERRLYRDVAAEFTIDDHGPAVEIGEKP